jgi:hypothetical protein
MNASVTSSAGEAGIPEATIRQVKPDLPLRHSYSWGGVSVGILSPTFVMEQAMNAHQHELVMRD